MKKIVFLSLLMASSLLMINCGPGKKAAATPKATFSKDVTAIIQTNCTPCHIPTKGGKKTAYDVYANVKADIDDIIRRVELNPDQRGFMPMRGQKLDAASIAVLKKWKEEGMNE